MTNWSFKILVLFLITTIVVPPLLLPRSANATIERSIVNVTACSSGGIIAGWLSDKIATGLSVLGSKLTGAIAKKIIGNIFGLRVPVHDTEFQSKYVTKETILDVIARCTAREILDKMVGNTLNVVRNHGRDGGTTFIQNWRNFTTNSQYRGENIFRAILSNTQLCDYFNNDFKTLFRANNKTALPGQNTRVDNLDPYQLRANCTMPAGWSMDAYRQDFSGNGGWLAFAKLLEPQNNTLGAYNLALEEINNQKGLEQTNDLAQAQAGGSYLGRSGSGKTDSCLLMGTNNKCLVYKNILTPGGTLRDSVSSTIQQEIAWITNVDELNEVIMALVSGLLNRILNLSNNDENRPINPEDLPIYNSTEGNLNEPDPGDLGLPPLEPPEEPNLNCEQQGLSDNYGGEVQTAIDNVPASLKDVPNSLVNEGLFLDAVVLQLRDMGLQAGRVDNGQLRYDTIIVGEPSDPDGTVYDLIREACSPGEVCSGAIINSLLVVYCVDHEPWSVLRDPVGGDGGGEEGAIGSISGYFSDPAGGVVLDYTTSNLCVDGEGISGAIIRRNGTDIFLITSNGFDLPAGIRIDNTYSGSGTYTYAIHDAGCGDPAKQKQLGSVSVTVP